MISRIPLRKIKRYSNNKEIKIEYLIFFINQEKGTKEEKRNKNRREK